MILNKIIRAIHRRRNMKFKRLIAEIYPNIEDRGYALLSEGAEIFNIICFNQGDPLRVIVITPDEEEGYNIEME